MKRLMFFTAVIITLCASTLFADDRMRIAVMDFEGKDMSRADAAKISELIRGEMVNAGQFIVIERAQMGQILKEQGFQQSGCTDISCAVQIGKILSANKILVGSAMEYRDKIIITGRIVDVEKGVAEFSEKIQADNKDDILDTVTEFTEKLSARILNAPLPEGGTRGASKEKFNIAIDIGTGEYFDKLSASLLFSNYFNSFFHYGFALSIIRFDEAKEKDLLFDYRAIGLIAEAGINYKRWSRVGFQPYLGLGYYKVSGDGCYAPEPDLSSESVTGHVILLSIGLRVPIRLGSSFYIYPFFGYSRGLTALEGEKTGDEYSLNFITAGIGIMF